MTALLDPAAARALIADGHEMATTLRSLGDCHLLRTPTRSLGTAEVASNYVSLLDGYEQALAEVERLHRDERRNLDHIARSEMQGRELAARISMLTVAIESLQQERASVVAGLREAIEALNSVPDHQVRWDHDLPARLEKLADDAAKRSI
ncbi:MAG TPA: hypothetical protein VLN57_21360 [Xanthobacteraceae bacterium]|nr:hypothetical protein [Xanthobacteraceae bacterium]